MTGWTIGFAVGAAVVLVVVILLVTMIVLARKITARAEAILAALHTARDNTEGLWDLAATNAVADRIVGGAADARNAIKPAGWGQ
jgi:hypothetical protein